MKLAALLLRVLLLGATGLTAQTTNANFASFQVVDECGGQPAFLGSSYILEESAGFCGGVNESGPVSSTQFTISGITWVSGQYTISTTTSSTMLSSLQTTDTIYISGSMMPSCLTTTSTGFAVLSSTSSSVTVKAPSLCNSSPTFTSGVIYGSYGTSDGSPRYELKLVHQHSGSWSPAPQVGDVTLMTDSTARTSLFGAANKTCSVGNPAGYFDGTNYYIAFIAQNSASCGSSKPPNSPGQGTQYDLWACNLGTSPTNALTGGTGGRCAKIMAANPSPNGGGFLDPRIFSNLHLYATERNDSNVLSALGSPSYGVWSVDDLTMNWSAGAPAKTATTTYVFNAGGWAGPTGRNRASAGCEQYYKLTGLLNLPAVSGTSVVRALFQANDINPGGSSPFQSYASGVTCDQMGAGGPTDQFIFSGLFYADLDGTAYMGTSVLTGSHYTQLYPSPSATSGANSCLTPGGWNYCYAEYPWIMSDGGSLMFLADPVTQSQIIDDCKNPRFVSGCKENYTSEVAQALVSTDYSSSTYPMRLLGVASYSNMQDLGTLNCEQLLSVGNLYTSCGLGALTPLFGNCGHLVFDEASQYGTCGNLTSFQNLNYSFTIRRTMIFSLSPSLLNRVTQAVGGVTMSGGVLVKAQ